MVAPKVSVITCSYNRPALLRAAVESLRAQTDPDWEHLIYDDASTDPAITGVLEWALRDPRTRVWRSRSNHDQPSHVWNFLMDRARGRYLSVLDDDNEKMPDFVGAMSRELDADRNLDAVTCAFRVDLPHGRPSYIFHINQETSAARLEEKSTCDGGAVLYTREAFERAGYFSESLRTNEDWDWLRRMVHVGRVKNLTEAHATYRQHETNRMWRADALGAGPDSARVRARPLEKTLRMRAQYPAPSRLTQSQRDVCAGVESALTMIPWVSDGTDLLAIVAPFQQTPDEIANIRAYRRVVSIHMEDPYALHANIQKVQLMTRLCPEVWVATCDAAAVPFYRKVVGDRVIVCPSLSADSSVAMPRPRERTIDVLLCGYAYPSRKKFVAQLLPLLRDLRGLRVALVGDGWAEAGATGAQILPTQLAQNTARLHAQARAVVCLHRVAGDCSDGPAQPQTVNRGFMEGRSGARVFIDRSRPLHSLDDGDVAWYSTPRDLADKLREYLAAGDDSRALAFAGRCEQVYTYRARVARILNCVRAPRFLAEIP